MIKGLLVFALSILFLPAVGMTEPIDARPIIDGLINKEIFISDVFAGQSIILVKDNDKYYVVRRIFGSGVPLAETITYSVTCDSDYQIRFSKVVKGERYVRKDLPPEQRCGEEFQLSIADNGMCRLFVNGMEVVIHDGAGKPVTGKASRGVGNSPS